MILDKQRNIWIKHRRPRLYLRQGELPPSEGSEEDPFAGIPDLTVDMTIGTPEPQISKRAR